MAGAALLGVYAAQPAQAALGKDPGTVTLNPASGSTSGKPTWSTSTACATGFQGSAIFREVHRDGSTTNSISPATNAVAAPFSGTLQAPITAIQAAGTIANGGTQELVVICFSGPSLTGTSDPEMDIFITYSADGSTYTSSGRTSPSPSGSPSPSRSGTGSVSPSSSSSVTTSPSTSSVSPSPTAPAQPAPSPTPASTNLAVTG